MRRLIFILGAVIILSAGLIFYLRPMFSINGKTVFRSEFEANLAAEARAQQNFQSANPGLPSKSDLEAAVAERILQNHLVHEELWSEIDSKTLRPLLDDKINSALGNSNFMSAAGNLYGLSPTQIRNYIIIPQAEEDILKSNLILKGENLSDWLSAAEKSAKVKIYFSSLRWSGSSFVR